VPVWAKALLKAPSILLGLARKDTFKPADSRDGRFPRGWLSLIVTGKANLDRFANKLTGGFVLSPHAF
jgi:hypothetical protein